MARKRDNFEPQIFKRTSKTDRRKDKWILRLKWRDSEDRLHSEERQFNSYKDALDHRPELEKRVANLKKSRGAIKQGERMTFADLVELAKRTIYAPATIEQGFKETGVKSYGSVYSALDVLSAYFGKKRIGDIAQSDLYAYRKWRFELGSRRGKERSKVAHSTVNRELEKMRRLMRYAKARKWIDEDIFEGARVINKAVEHPRRRLLTAAEEIRLLEACAPGRKVTYERKRNGKVHFVTRTVQFNPFLKSIVLLALDSALRKGEILSLRWEDIDLNGKVLHVVGTHTKTEMPRTAPLTQRTIAELVRLPSFGRDELVYPQADCKRSFETAKTVAGVSDLHFHDLRSAAITKFQQRGLSEGIAGKLAGHADIATTRKYYTLTDVEVARQASERLDAYHEEIQVAQSLLIN